MQTTIPDYRRPFFAALSETLGPRLELVSGDEDWEPGIVHSRDVAQTRVRNVFLARRRLLWQRGVLGRVLGADVAVLSLNPRILTSWIALLLRRLLRRRTVLWGHAWPRKGAASTTDVLRATMRRLASTLIVYTQSEADLLRRRFPGTDVVAAPNALYRQSEMQPSASSEPPTDLVCVGRLVESKRPLLLLDAFLVARPDLPADVRLVYVGDGPLRGELERRVQSADLESRTVLTGHISSTETLREIYARAIASVAPGYAGLSLTQSLAFGVPTVLARDANHGPEVEAVAEGMNAVLFESGSSSSLAQALVAVVAERDRWLARRNELSEATRAHYSIERMAESFVGALGPAARGKVYEPR